MKAPYPQPSIRRLPSYLRLLQPMAAAGLEKVSCTAIAAALQLDATQVRKDLSITGISGRPRIGYDLRPLIAAIEAFLGWNKTTDAVLVGCGSLGHAIMGYGNFPGLRIVSAFDTDPAKIGTKVFGCQIRHLQALGEYIRKHRIPMGIITVPASEAQTVGLAMDAAGIRGIWNFAPTKLTLSENIIVENVEMASSLAVLSANMTALKKGR